MDALARPIIPPAPYVHPEDLSTPRLVVATLSNTLGNWSKNAFDIPWGRRNRRAVGGAGRDGRCHHVFSAARRSRVVDAASARLIQKHTA
eukprot:gene3877-5301_t